MVLCVSASLRFRLRHSALSAQHSALRKELQVDKRKVGILTFSDGRDFAHKLQYDMDMQFQHRLVHALAATGEIEPVPCDLVWTTELARSEGRKLRGAGAEGPILNYSISARPQLSSL